MDLGLNKKVVLVTGGAKGIGKAIVEALVRERGIPVIVGRDQNDNLQLEQQIKDNGGIAYSVQAELTDKDACSYAVAQAIELCGRIDGIVNNAGVNDGVGLGNGSYESFMASLHKNLVHYYLITHFALPELRKTKGSIVNIGSKTAETGQGNTSGYAASNGGRNALTREWAVELLPFGIRVNAVIVAECYTPLYEKWIKNFSNPKEKLKTITDRIPLERRMTSAEEIANTVLFLLSRCSSHTTGQLIHVDGGYVHLDRAI